MCRRSGCDLLPAGTIRAWIQDAERRWRRRREENKGIVRQACICTVNSSRMHRADQTPWLTLRFTTPRQADPCNGPHVPIGGVCHPDLPDSKLLSRSAAPHLLLPPGLPSFLTSLCGRRSFVILHQSLSTRSPYLTPVTPFLGPETCQRFCFDRRRLPCLHIHSLAHLHIHKPVHIFSLGHIRPHYDLTLLILNPSLPLEHLYLAYAATICHALGSRCLAHIASNPGLAAEEKHLETMQHRQMHHLAGRDVDVAAASRTLFEGASKVLVARSSSTCTNDSDPGCTKPTQVPILAIALAIV